MAKWLDLKSLWKIDILTSCIKTYLFKIWFSKEQDPSTKMISFSLSNDIADPFDLNRFIHAQNCVYEQALDEIKKGQKRSHWMWYIFPQIDGLGRSPTAKRYAIKHIEEARAYLSHPILGVRLVECAEAALSVAGRSAAEIFGSPDDMKLKSCATLFAQVSPANSVFEQLLDRFFDGDRDLKTLAILNS